VRDRERRRLLDQRLVDFDHAEGGPLRPERVGRSRSRDQLDGADRLAVADAAGEPAIGGLHRLPDEVASGLGDVALDQRARVEVEDQSSASRSASTAADAEAATRAGWGGCPGRDAPAGTSRPAATRLRSAP